MAQKKFLTTADITDLYGIDDVTVRELVDNGDLKALADRGTWKYRREDIEALITSGRLHPTKELPVVDDIDFDETIGFADESAVMSEQVDFIELDEEALADQATIISSGSPAELDHLQLSFHTEPVESESTDGPSSSDVEVFDAEETSGSESDFFQTGSSAEVPVAEEAEDPSHSDVTMADLSATDFSSLDDLELEAPAENATGFDLDMEEDDAVIDDSEASIMTESELVIPEGESGISFETQDSGLTLASPDSDSDVQMVGSPVGTTDDEGMAFDTEDSGLTLDTGDSGLTLDTGDSGLTLDTGDSGLTLDFVSDSDVTIQKAETTQRMQEPGLDSLADELDFDSESGDSGGTRRLAVDEQFAEEIAFVADDEDDANQTAVLMVDDDDATSDYIGTLSGAIDAGQAVEDLEVVDELDEVLDADDEEFDTAQEEDIIDAEDSAFSDEFEGESAAEDDEDSYLTPAAKSLKPREPSWGAPAALMVIVAGVLMGTNAWLIVEGMMTMWTGAETSGPAASIISSLSGLIG
ncbi:helix-turn-helix domain-containing protein [bacterium]|nr:helix-turn-helix domain-containing protein [bacterium]